MEDLKDTVIFADMIGHGSVYSNPEIASELSGYIHYLHDTGKVIYSYHVKDKTISMSSMHCLDLPPLSETNCMSVWGMPELLRLQGDHNGADLKQGECKGDEMVVRSTTSVVDDDEVKQTHKAHLLNIPFEVLEMIMEFCVGIEYLNFRATCKHCRLAAPLIDQWSNEKMRLQTPWLMALDKESGIMTFTDPMFGDDKYFIKASPDILFFDGAILCSRYGWLLLFIEDLCLAFYNPFTNDIHKLPRVMNEENFCFSAPPTSPDCMVVGFSTSGPWNIHIHFVAGEPYWRTIELDFHRDDSIRFPTCWGRDAYFMLNDGGLEVVKEIRDFDNYDWETIVDAAAAPRRDSSEYFQSKCDQHYLLVIVGEFGEPVEVFELNDCTEEWEKIDSLGKHMVYICDTTCVCMDAKIPETENKIYFPRLNCENENIVFYSMETRMYHTFNGRNVEQDNVRYLFGTTTAYLYSGVD